jgi:hypothetical protein
MLTLRYFSCVIALCAIGCNTLFGVEEGVPRVKHEGGSAGEGAAGEGAAQCKTNAECLETSGEDRPSACVNGSCVPLITEECPLLLPQIDRQWLANLKSTDPEPLIFGAFAHVPTDALVSIPSQNYDLSLNDLTQIVGGLPAAGGKSRKVLALVCRNVYDDPAGLDRAVDHLVTDLSVPAIIAGLETLDFERAFARSADRHVFFMNPYGAEANADVNGDGLIWSMLPAAKDLAPTYEPLLSQTIDHLRGTGALEADEKARVALVYDEDYRAPFELAHAVMDVIEFNGKSALDNTKDGYFKSYSIQSQALSSQTLDYTAVIDDLIDFAPHVVISLATKEFPSDFMFLLEYAGKPTYLLGPWNYHDDNVTYLTSVIGDLRPRIIGTNYAAATDPTVYDAYVAHYAATFPGQAGTEGYENHYDAGYYLLYAAIAAGARATLTGPDLTTGMRRLLGGSSAFAVGPTDLPDASRQLRTPSNSITLNGAMGPPDFDAATGVRHDSSTVWCVGPDLAVHADVLRLDGDGNLTGDFSCFPFP